MSLEIRQHILACEAAAAAKDHQGFCFYGIVTDVVGGTSCKVARLVGYEDDFFKDNYYMFVVRDAGGAGAVPQGEMQPISNYVSSDGTFTHIAFAASLAVDDEVMIMHESAVGAVMIAFASLPAAPVAGSLASFIASGGTALGTMLPASKSLYDAIALDRLDHGTYGLSALNTDLDAILADTITLLQKATKAITLSTAAVPVTETLFTVTGEVELYVIGYIDTAVTSVGALTLEVGTSGNTAGLIAQTVVGALLIDLLWMDATPATLVSKPSEKIVANGADIIHTIAGAAASTGAITYYCWWRPLSSDGNVVAA